MKKWNRDTFNNAVNNLKITYSKRDKINLQETQGYDFRKKSDIYLYIADIVLNGNCVKDTVVGWTKPNSNGPREAADIRLLEKFLGVILQTDEYKGEEKMKVRYSDFIKERVFEVHVAVLKYLEEHGDEMAFWNMCDTIDYNKVAIPDQVYQVVQGFVDQYLEEDLFGAIYGHKERVDFDLTEFELIEKECPNPDVGPSHVAWFKLKNMYDAIAEKYIRPILVEPEEK